MDSIFDLIKRLLVTLSSHIKEQKTKKQFDGDSKRIQLTKVKLRKHSIPPKCQASHNSFGPRNYKKRSKVYKF